MVNCMRYWMFSYKRKWNRVYTCICRHFPGLSTSMLAHSLSSSPLSSFLCFRLFLQSLESLLRSPVHFSHGFSLIITLCVSQYGCNCSHCVCRAYSSVLPLWFLSLSLLLVNCALVLLVKHSHTHAHKLALVLAWVIKFTWCDWVFPHPLSLCFSLSPHSIQLQLLLFFPSSQVIHRAPACHWTLKWMCFISLPVGKSFCFLWCSSISQRTLSLPLYMFADAISNALRFLLANNRCTRYISHSGCFFALSFLHLALSASRDLVMRKKGEITINIAFVAVNYSSRKMDLLTTCLENIVIRKCTSLGK